MQVLHARGPKNTDVTVPPRPAGSAPYVVVDYLERMDLAYAAADLALCRAGAVTVAELSAVGLPAAFVPLPIGNGEQRRNALPVVDAGGGLLVEDADLGRGLDRGAAAAAAHRPRGAGRLRPARRRGGGAGRGRAARGDGAGGGGAMSAEDVANWTAPVPTLDELGAVHFVGIGGAGMSGIARILLARGVRVSGSDRRDTPTLLALRALGARVEVGHDPAHLGDADTVVVSTAIRLGQPRTRDGAGARRCGCCRARSPWPRSWPAGGASRSPAPTARPRRRRC